MSLSELFRTCRTFRRFRQDPVPEDLLKEMLDNARIASSARNAQPLRYIVVRTPEMVAKMQPLVKWASSLPNNLGTPKEGEQPTAFVVVSKTADANSYSDVDLGLAVDAMVMTAWEKGFGSCIMGAINIPKIRELLGVPEEEEIRLAIAFGKPAHTSTVVGPREDGSIKYYIDEDVQYYVPKRRFEDVVHFV